MKRQKTKLFGTTMKKSCALLMTAALLVPMSNSQLLQAIEAQAAGEQAVPSGTITYSDVADTGEATNLIQNGTFDNDDYGSDGIYNGWGSNITKIKPAEVTPAETEVKINLVQNPGFENNGNGWTLASNASIVTDPVHGGSGALKINNGYAQSYAITVEANTTYTLKYYLKTASKGKSYVQIRYYNGSTKISEEDIGIERGQVEWTEYSFKITTPADTTKLYILPRENTTAADAYFDDFVLGIETVKQIPGNNLVTNGDLESSNNGWSLVANTADSIAKHVTDPVHGGSGALQLNNGYAQTIAISVKANTTYMLKYWMKSEGAGNSYVQVRYFSSDGKKLSEENVGTVTSQTDWAEYSFELKTPENATALRILPREMKAGVNAYFDDFFLGEMKEATETISAGIHENYGRNGTKGLMSEAVKYEQCIENYYDGIGKSLVAGKDYVFSAWCKTEGMASNANFRPVVEERGTPVKRTNACDLIRKDQDWTQIIYKFTATEKMQTEGVRFYFIQNNVGKVLIDDVVLYEAQESTLPKDNMVSNGNTMKDWKGMTTITCFKGLGGQGQSASGELTGTLMQDVSYIVKFRADVTGLDKISLTLGDCTLTSEELTVESGWKDFSCELTVTDTTNGSITIETANNKLMKLDDVVVYRKYELGDSNGDGTVDCRDIVRMKRSQLDETAAGYAELKTYIFSDLTDHLGEIVDNSDVEQLRKLLVGTYKN